MDVLRSTMLAMVLAMLVGLPVAGRAETTERSRDFEFTYRAVVEDLPAGTHDVQVWLPYPTSDAHQRVEVTEISAPVPAEITHGDEFGNAILHLAAEDPGTTEVPIEMKVRVHREEFVRRDFARAAPHEPARLGRDLARYLEPDVRVPLDERIRRLAAQVTEGAATDLAKARAIYDYVVDTMRYDKSGSGWGHGDIYWACDAKRGNCTDFHSLFIGLVRAVGIPARFDIGFPIPSDRGQGEVGGYHCWAEFYLAGYGWVPVDASEAWKHPERRAYFFGAHDENRVQFSQGRDIELTPRQSAGPLNYFIYPYVEVDGRPYDHVTHRFSYRDLGRASENAAGRRRRAHRQRSAGASGE